MRQLRKLRGDRCQVDPVVQEPSRRHFLIGFTLLAACALTGCAPVAHKPNIEHMLATATTASDHEAIAQYYEQEAADDEIKYEGHMADAGRYEHSHKFAPFLAQHCRQLAQDYKQASEDASVLAAQHRKVAEEMRSGSEPSSAVFTPGSSAQTQ